MSFKKYFYNEYKIYKTAGTFTWVKPSDLDSSKPILVHAWGAGGCGGATSNVAGHGAGGGGLAVKYVDAGSLSSTETITIGAGSEDPTLIGGTTSFGSHCSATGGNGGENNTANQGSAADFGVGGLGVGGDVNKRGGQGQTGYYSATTNCGGGGGGSAPAPYGVSDGFRGGKGYTRSGGGGGGIGGDGSPQTNLGTCFFSGGGSMSESRRPGSGSASPAQAGGGICGPGGTNPSMVGLAYLSYGADTFREGSHPSGEFLLSPNEILPGGGGGSGMGAIPTPTTHETLLAAQCGAPGGGGGGSSQKASEPVIVSAGDGGFLGGGGGAGQSSEAGRGGNAGGGGGRGSTLLPAGGRTYGFGGDGVVIIQYARLV